MPIAGQKNRFFSYIILFCLLQTLYPEKAVPPNGSTACIYVLEFPVSLPRRAPHGTHGPQYPRSA